MFRFPDWCYRKLPSNQWFWIAVWIFWLAVLCLASSSNPEMKDGPDIPHLDKIVHFCYFMAGGFSFANFLFLKKSEPWSWNRIILFTLVVGACVGGLDEFHQSFTPGREGNDLGDWIADVTGTLAGAYYCFFMWVRLKKLNHQIFRS